MTDEPTNESRDPEIPPDRATSAAARRSALARHPADGASGPKDGEKITWSDSAEQAPRPRHGMSIAALVLGGISLIGLLVLGLLDIVVIVAAIVIGVLALLRIRKGLGGRKSFAIAGIACGLVAAILFGVLVYTTSRRITDCGHKLGRDLHGLSTKDLQKALQQCDKMK